MPSEEEGATQETGTDLQSILRAIAETQRALVAHTRPSSSTTAGRQKQLSYIKLNEFVGGRQTTARQYRAWRKHVDLRRTSAKRD